MNYIIFLRNYISREGKPQRAQRAEDGAKRELDPASASRSPLRPRTDLALIVSFVRLQCYVSV